ncbi:hypothetical protein HDU89_008464 [Geranomyces variabilis]|nr:hypothetical protein HDU89_008464 [Geranomyces variabilis]
MGCASSKSSKSPADSNKVVPVSVPPAALNSTDAAPVASVQAAYPAQPAAAATSSKPPTPPGGGGSGPVDRIKSAEKLPLGSRSSLDKPLMPPIQSTTTPATSSAAAATTSASPPPSLTSSQQNVSAVSGPAAALAAAAAKRNGSGNKVHPAPSGENSNSQTSPVEAAVASSSKPGSAGSVSYVPVYSKAAEGPLKPVAFEIPLGEMLFTAPSWKQSGDVKLSTSTVPKLPSLQGLTSDAIAAKLANADRRWKDLDDHEIARKKSTRRRRQAGSKPELSSSSRPKTRGGTRPDINSTNNISSTAIAATAADAETDDQLKLRLLEKEAHAERNRKKELEKLTAKLRRMDQHVRSVQERKRVLERGESEDEVVMSGSQEITNWLKDTAGETNWHIAGLK